MSRGPCTFKQNDVTRLVKALVAAGVEVARVEMDKDGKIAVFAGKVPEALREGARECNEWDGVA
jgi:hypothetical protein